MSEFMESKHAESITLESGALPIENSCEIARFHDVLGEPERLIVLGAKENDDGIESRFSYTRYQTDVESFEDSTFYDMPTIDLFADLLLEFCNEYNANPLTCISCVEQLVMQKQAALEY